MCCDSWGHKELDTTERLNCTEVEETTSTVTYYLILNISHSGRDKITGMENRFLTTMEQHKTNFGGCGIIQYPVCSDGYTNLNIY